MQCKEWGDANSKLFKESHDEAVYKNSYKSTLCELISASLISKQIHPNERDSLSAESFLIWKQYDKNRSPLIFEAACHNPQRRSRCQTS